MKQYQFFFLHMLKMMKKKREKFGAYHITDHKKVYTNMCGNNTTPSYTFFSHISLLKQNKKDRNRFRFF